MATEFSTAFSLLRREKGISQREAASDLGISQALLSHYENGVREPRLEFVAKACEYYGVSADFLLGRTGARENPCALFSQTENSVWNEDGIADTFNAAAVLLGVIYASCGREGAARAAEYLRTTEYKVFRFLELSGGVPGAETGTVPDCRFRSLCDAVMRLSESELSMLLREAAADAKVREAFEDFASSNPDAQRRFSELMRRADEDVGALMRRG